MSGEGNVSSGGQTGGFEIDTPSFEGKSEVWFDNQIQLGRKDPDFQKGSRLKGDRAELVQNQITKLYENHPRYKKGSDVRAATPEQDRGLHDRLTEIGLDKEIIEREGQESRDAMQDEAAHRTYLEAEGQLRQIWGSEEAYNQNISRVHFAIDQIVKDPAEREAIISRYGNDLEMVQALSIVVQKLDDLFFEGKAKSYKRKEQK
jgi:hypothetical protein